MGGRGTRRPGADVVGRLADRCVRGFGPWRLLVCHRAGQCLGRPVRLHRTALQHGLRTGLVRHGAARARADGGLGVFVESARGTYGLPQSQRRRERSRPGGRLHGHDGTAAVCVCFGAGHVVPHRTLPRLRRFGRRVRSFRGLRRGPAQAAARRGQGRRPDPRRAAWHRNQPGRTHREHFHPVPGCAGGGVSRGLGGGRCRRRHRRHGRGARHRHPCWRSDRVRKPGKGLWQRPGLRSGIGQEQSGSSRGRRGCGGIGQSRPVAAA